jgi:hemin uptake protein HemP
MPKASPHPAGDGQSPLPLAQGSARDAQAAGMHSTGCVDSKELLRGQKTVEISHNGSTYRLQATRLGKLILTK